MHANTRAYTRTNRTNIVFFCEKTKKSDREIRGIREDREVREI